MARVNDGSHSFTCHPQVYPQVEWTTPAFTPQPQSVNALWPVILNSIIYNRILCALSTWDGYLSRDDMNPLDAILRRLFGGN